MVSESDRQRFLTTLSGYCDIPEKNLPGEKEPDVCLADQIDSLLKALKEIQTGDRELESEYNEEWDEWQDDDEDAFRFTDSDNILVDIAIAVKALHQCLDQEEYEKGAKLAKVLSELTVHVSGDCDDDEMGIRELTAYDLLDINIKETVKEAMYLAFMGTREPGRAEAMLTIMEAFRTSPTVENYLRLRLQSRCWENYADKARDIYTAYYMPKSTWEQKPLAALMFFDERFEEMIDQFMKAGKGIGWSSTFMKEGIALMLMLMNSGAASRPGISTMREMAIRTCSFDSDSYCEGTDLEHGTSTAVLFQDCFQRWKTRIVIPETICESWLKKIDNWIALRVSAIMDANRRNYYGECAAFVAAYGEVRESRGKPGEKDRIMQQYRADYSRRRAFHDELRRFGMLK